MGKKTALLTLAGTTYAIPMMAMDLEAASQVVQEQGVLGLTFLAFTMLLGGMALWFEYRQRYKGKKSFLRYAVQNRFVKLLFGCITLVVFVGLFIGEREAGSGQAELEFAKNHKMHRRGAEIYLDLLERYPFVPAYHYGYVTAYYAVDDWAEEDWDTGMNPEDLVPPLVYYSNMVEYQPGRFRLIGLLGQGMTMYHEGRTRLAENVLKEIPPEALPYRNLYLARISEKQGLPLAAEIYLQMEMTNGGDTRLVSLEMTKVVETFHRADTAKLRAIVEDSIMGPYAAPELGRNLYVRSGELGKYAETIFISMVRTVNWVGFLASVAGVLFWAVFLRRVDAAGKIDRWAMAAMWGAGALFCLLALPAHDYLVYEIGFHRSGDFWEDLFYVWITVGVMEELVKFLPLLLLWRSTRLVNSPLAFIVFASLSGLGFAFMENYLVYFTEGNESVIHTRLLISVLMHMFCSSLIAYGIVLAKYRYQKSILPFAFIAFLTSTVFHGLFDFFLVSHTASIFAFVSFALFLYASYQYGAFLNNALNNDPEFNPRRLLSPRNLLFYLLSGLVGLMMFEFLSIALLYGGEVAVRELLQNLALGSFLIFFLVMNLSNIDIVKGEWFWTRPWNFRTHQDYNEPLGKKFRLRPHDPNSILQGMLPASGEVVARARIKGDSRYYIFRFENPVRLLGHPVVHVLMRASDPDELIESGYKMPVSLIAFRNEEALTKKDQTMRDFRHLDKAIVE